MANPSTNNENANEKLETLQNKLEHPPKKKWQSTNKNWNILVNKKKNMENPPTRSGKSSQKKMGKPTQHWRRNRPSVRPTRLRPSRSRPSSYDHWRVCLKPWENHGETMVFSIVFPTSSGIFRPSWGWFAHCFAKMMINGNSGILKWRNCTI